MHNSFMLI